MQAVIRETMGRQIQIAEQIDMDACSRRRGFCIGAESSNNFLGLLRENTSGGDTAMIEIDEEEPSRQHISNPNIAALPICLYNVPIGRPTRGLLRAGTVASWVIGRFAYFLIAPKLWLPNHMLAATFQILW